MLVVFGVIELLAMFHVSIIHVPVVEADCCGDKDGGSGGGGGGGGSTPARPSFSDWLPTRKRRNAKVAASDVDLFISSLEEVGSNIGAIMTIYPYTKNDLVNVVAKNDKIVAFSQAARERFSENIGVIAEYYLGIRKELTPHQLQLAHHQDQARHSQGDFCTNHAAKVEKLIQSLNDFHTSFVAILEERQHMKEVEVKYGKIANYIENIFTIPSGGDCAGPIKKHIKVLADYYTGAIDELPEFQACSGQQEKHEKANRQKMHQGNAQQGVEQNA